MSEKSKKEKIADVVDKAATVVAIIETPFCLPITALTTKFICKKIKKSCKK